MAEAAQGTPQEFWRPPSQRLGSDVLIQASTPSLADACPRCGSEYLVGSQFCHSCGGRRPEALSSSARTDAAAVAGLWEKGVQHVRTALTAIPWQRMQKVKFPAWMQYLHFHEIKSRAGLSTGSLIAFVIGLACVAGALMVGLLTAKTLVDWQAIQFYRAEWLLAATAAFVAGILLKKSSPDHD